MSKLNQLIVSELSQGLRGIDALLYAGFSGMSTETATSLRSELRKEDYRLRVVRNRLFRLALEELQVDAGAMPKGEMALVYREGGKSDPVRMSQILVDWTKKSEKLTLKGGLLSGKSLTADQVLKLSKIPPREVLLSCLLGALLGPMSGLVRVLAGPLSGLVRVLDQIKRQKEGS